MLLLIGEDDHLYSPAQLQQIERRLREEQVRHEMIVYPDAPHGFFCHERDTYRPQQADDAFARLTTLLRASHAPPPISRTSDPDRDGRALGGKQEPAGCGASRGVDERRQPRA